MESFVQENENTNEQEQIYKPTTKPKNSYKRWNEIEETQLLNELVFNNYSVNELSNLHERTVGGIVQRIPKLIPKIKLMCKETFSVNNKETQTDEPSKDFSKSEINEPISDFPKLEINEPSNEFPKLDIEKIRRQHMFGFDFKVSLYNEYVDFISNVAKKLGKSTIYIHDEIHHNRIPDYNEYVNFINNVAKKLGKSTIVIHNEINLHRIPEIISSFVSETSFHY